MTKPNDRTPESAQLADFLCFAVYSANLVFGRAYKSILDELGLTYTQWIVIVALWEQDDQTVKHLGERLYLESNTLTPLLKKLEDMGYVQRRRNPQDERQVLVTLTEAGKQLRDKGCQKNLMAATGLDPEEFRTVQKALDGSTSAL